MRNDEKDNPIRMIKIIILTLTSPFILGILLYILSSFTLFFCQEGWLRIVKGMSKKQVISILGRPYKVCDLKKGSLECNIDGYKLPERKKATFVLGYRGCSKVLFIYFGSDGKVLGKWWSLGT